MQSNKIEIKVDKINYKYSNGNQAIIDASFTLKEGVICALVGPNGGGKSTLFKSLMGFVKPYSGRISFNNQTVNQTLKKNRIAYVPQTEEVDWDFPILVKDVVLMGRYSQMNFLRIPSAEDIKVVNESLELVGLANFANRQIGELSGGQKKRVFLARALAQEGDILMLDEPFTGVDVQTENAIIELLQSLRKKGSLILIATHNLGSVPDFCDEVVLFNKTVIGFGSIKNTFTEENLKKTFGGVLRHIRLGNEHLHDDDDPRVVTVLTDDERPAVFYGNTEQDPPKSNKDREL